MKQFVTVLPLEMQNIWFGKMRDVLKKDSVAYQEEYERILHARQGITLPGLKSRRL
jgi:hypothetical protein